MMPHYAASYRIAHLHFMFEVYPFCPTPFPLPLAIKLFSALYDISIKWHNEIGRVQRLLLQAAND